MRHLRTRACAPALLRGHVLLIANHVDVLGTATWKIPMFARTAMRPSNCQNSSFDGLSVIFIFTFLYLSYRGPCFRTEESLTPPPGRCLVNE